MSLAFAFWADPVEVERRGPGVRVRKWQVRIQTDGDHALIRVGTDVQPGDEIITATDFFGRPRKRRIVAEVDWDSRADEKLGVITWAGATRIRQRQKEARTALDLQVHGLLLLEWLYDNAGDRPEFDDVNPFVADYNLPEGSGRLLVDNLALRGAVVPLEASGRRLEARITALGMDHVQRIRAERRDPVRRSRELRQRMLCWLYAKEHEDVSPPDWGGFLTGEEGRFMGDPFTLVEMEREAGYLTDRGFMTGTSIDQAGPGTMKPRLTSSGRDCVMDFGGNVSDYRNRPQSGGTTNNITMTGSTGNIVVASENVMQNIQAGLDTRKLLEFAGFVRQVLPTLGLADDQRDEVDAAAAELHEAAESVVPDRGRLRRLLDAVVLGLTQAAPSVAKATAITIGEDALRALTS